MWTDNFDLDEVQAPNLVALIDGVDDKRESLVEMLLDS